MRAKIDEEGPFVVANALDRLGQQQAPTRALGNREPALPKTGSESRCVRRRHVRRVGSADPLDPLVRAQPVVFADAIDEQECRHGRAFYAEAARVPDLSAASTRDGV